MISQRQIQSEPATDSHVRTVGIMAVNMRKRRPKNRNPALLYALVDSLPMLR